MAELYLASWSQGEIARELGVSQATVSSDLKKLAQAWRDSAARDFDLARGLELERLDRIEREAWAAFERSKKPAETAVVSGEAQDRKLRRSLKHQHGEAEQGPSRRDAFVNEVGRSRSSWASCLPLRDGINEGNEAIAS